MTLRVGPTVLTTTDLPRAVAFWTTALGLRTRDAVGPDTDFVVLIDPGARPDQAPDGDADPGPTPGAERLSLQLGEVRERTEPVRVHLDLYADDQAGEVRRLVGLGARKLPWDYPEDPDFVVLADPDGHPFCVVAKG
ncbi:VOC family protein [Embleya sp. NPDC008237]|uniref:VOC family protein n=1 Tax=Embleya sp. NPDC008237 TaxID=3363978 RepID=UPI0036E233DA